MKIWKKNNDGRCQFEDYVAELGYIYWFNCHNKDEAEYFHPFVEKFFLEVDIRIFGAAYRDANDNAWKPLNEK